MNKNLLLFIYFICFVFFNGNKTNAQTLSKFITVDQFGYRPTAQKIAVLRDPLMGFDAGESFTPGGSYALVNAINNTQVFTGSPTIWQNGKTDSLAGDKAWWFDFSSYTTPGSYYVLDVQKNVRSYTFEIKEDVYNEVFRHAVRFFFYQRSGFAKNLPYAEAGWVDGASHLKPLQDKNCRYYLTPNDASSEKDLRGGWYDAGDFNKYTTWTSGYIIALLKAYEESPATWTDDFNIPESNNNFPDILDEVKWGMDYLLRLQNSNGSVISLVGVESVSPPSSATQPSKYANATTAASLKASAAFAFGAKIFRKMGLPCYADSLQNAAIKAWNWAEANPSVTWDNTGTGVGVGNPEVNDYGRLMFKLEAAVHLYALTNEVKYRTFFDTNYSQGHLIQWYYAFPYEHDEQEVLLYYTTLPDASSAVVSTIKDRYLTGINRENNFGAFDSKKAAYLTYLESYVWGSNNIASMQGLMFYESVKYNINPSRNSDALKAAENYIHYVHGLNPLNQCYLTNMNKYGADKSATQTFHSWFMDGSAKWDQVGVSTYGPAPGFLVGGANSAYNVDGCCTYNSCGSIGNNALCNNAAARAAIGQPSMKSFADINDSWPINTWAITEPSCGYQVAYIRLLSKFVKANGVNPSPVNLSCSAANFPTVSISAPVNNATFVAPATVNLTATASDPNGTVTKVEFYNGTTKLGEDATLPYNFSWTNVAAGTYIVTAKATDNSGNQATSVAITIIVNVPLVASITAAGFTSFCTGGSVVLNANTGTGYTYQWKRDGSNIASATASSYTATQSGSYTVTVTANSQTANSTAVNVIVNATPSAPVVTSPVTYCQNAAATQLTASGTNLKWYTVSTGGTSSSTAPTPSTATVGTTNHYVSQTASGCESARSTIVVTVNALPVITPYIQVNGGAWLQQNTAQVCSGGSLVLGPQPVITTGWNWTGPNGYASTTREISLADVSSNQSGVYTASYTVNGCSSTQSFNLTVNAVPNAPEVNLAIAYCQNASPSPLSATGSDLKWYTVSTGGASSSTAPTPSTTSEGTTNHYVSQTANGCESSRATIAVKVNSLPNAIITPSGPTTFVTGGSVTLNANTGTNLNYKWFNGTTQVGTGSSYEASTTGSYTVEVTNGSGCKATSSATTVTVNQNQPSVITIVSPTSNSSVSGPITITTTVSDPDGGITKVEYLDGSIVIGTSTSSPYTFTWDNPSVGDHVITVRATDSNGGVTTSSPVKVTASSITGIQGAIELYGVVYPNPSNGEVIIEANMDLTDAKVTLINVLGKEEQLPTKVNGRGLVIDASGLSEGTYILIVRHENGVLLEKIAITK